MDKYEFNVKVEQIRKLVNKGDFETAMKITDTIDWKKVRNANLLSMVSQVYEKNEEYQDAKDILQLAFERAPIGKRFLYKLTELALKEGNTDEAEAYYREFCDMAGDDSRQYLLRYMILKAKNAPIEQMIHALESYTAEELDEKWLYELAELYHEAGDTDRCVSVCDKIMLMFGLGKYVDKAMELKLQYAPLTGYQMDLFENREKYEEKLRAVAQSFQDVAETEGEYHEGAGAASTIVTEEETEPAAPEKIWTESPVPAATVAEPVRAEVPQPQPIVPEPATAESLRSESVAQTRISSQIQEAVVQAETEEELKKEVSRMKEAGAETSRVLQAETEEELGKTKILTDLHRKKPQEAKASVAEEGSSEGRVSRSEKRTEAKGPEVITVKTAPVRKKPHQMIEARTPEKGLAFALELLKQTQRETGIKAPVAKISGSRLNNKGILSSADKLSGKILMIEEAGDLSPAMVDELERLLEEKAGDIRVILIDNARQLDMLLDQSPVLADRFERMTAVEAEDMPAPEKKKAAPVAEPALKSPKAKPAPEPQPEPADDREELDIDEFAQYACQYAARIDCSITGKSMLALYERIEIMEEDGIPLTRANAEALIEEAADKAEKPGLGGAIKGLFSAKYNKDGLLILKEAHFIS
ncbi:MAG: hypothetical protein LIO92_12000 [Clostridiales bacterium]|nr:hypothetical protein [Clostridiales bacterium]